MTWAKVTPPEYYWIGVLATNMKQMRYTPEEVGKVLSGIGVKLADFEIECKLG